MINWILNIKQNGNVWYIMQNGAHPVCAVMPVHDALKRLPQNGVRISDRFDGFPLTGDDVFFFDGEYEEVGDE